MSPETLSSNGVYLWLSKLSHPCLSWPSSGSSRKLHVLIFCPRIINYTTADSILILAGWYISHGDDDRAREILARYHGRGNLNSEIVGLQMREMKEVIETENGTDKRSAGS